jgi:hypothetical protein
VGRSCILEGKATDSERERGLGFCMAVCAGNEEVRGGSTVGLKAPGRGGRMGKWAVLPLVAVWVYTVSE